MVVHLAFDIMTHPYCTNPVRQVVSDDLNTFAYDANVAGSGMHGGVGLHQALKESQSPF